MVAALKSAAGAWPPRKRRPAGISRSRSGTRVQEPAGAGGQGPAGAGQDSGEATSDGESGPLDAQARIGPRGPARGPGAARDDPPAGAGPAHRQSPSRRRGRRGEPAAGPAGRRRSCRWGGATRPPPCRRPRLRPTARGTDEIRPVEHPAPEHLAEDERAGHGADGGRGQGMALAYPPVTPSSRRRPEAPRQHCAWWSTPGSCAPELRAGAPPADGTRRRHRAHISRARARACYVDMSSARPWIHCTL